MGRNKSRKPEIPLKSKLKKDPGVPRLADIRLKNAEKLMLKERAEQPTRTDPDTPMASEPTLSSLAQLAESASAQAHGAMDTPDAELDGPHKTKEQLRRHYVRALHKVVDESDIIVLVLDARDPIGCRSRLVEEEVRRREHEGKRLVFVLNKIDLVPKENAQQWLRYLRHSAPTLPFRCPSNHQRSNLSSRTAPALLRLIKACRSNQSHAVTVGVVGYPNVGKSSLINALKRAKVCAVASQPGHTKELQSVQLERGLRIVDSPGVIFDEGEDPSGKAVKSEINLLLRNVVRVEDIPDPIAVADIIIAAVNPQTLQDLYRLPQWRSSTEFLTMVSLASGKLLPGGMPDVDAAARTLINDWNAQKITYCTHPPTVHPSLVPSRVAGGDSVAPGAEDVGQARIVEGEMSKPFVLEGLFGDADEGAFGDAEMREEDAAEGEVVPEATMDAPPEDAMEAEDELSPSIPRKRGRSVSPTPSISLSQVFEPTDAPRPVAPFPVANERGERMPKRLRRNKDMHVEAHTRSAMASARKQQKTDRKKARKAARGAVGVRATGMEVDEGLQGTFMAT